MPNPATQPPTILYVRPSDPRRTAIAEYADHFEEVLRRIEGARVVPLLPPDLSERIDSREDRNRVVRFASDHARLYREFGRDLVVHVELGNSLHREFWAGYALMRRLPRARFFCTIHDPPTLCSNPYRYIQTEFEGRTPLRLLDVALTKTAESVVGWMKRRVERRFARGCRNVLALTRGGIDAVRRDPAFQGPELIHIPHVFSGDCGTAALGSADTGQGATSVSGASPHPTPSVPSTSSTSSITVGMFCFLGPSKGIEELLEAFDSLSTRLEPGLVSEAPPRLAIFGAAQQGVATESYFERVRARIERSPFRDRIDFSPGYVDRDERARRLAAIDVLVLPFAPEKRVVFCSGSLIRAMGLGKAIVASRTGTVEEEISDGQNGLLYPPGDCDALAGQLLSVVSDAGLRERLARSAAAHIAAEHSPDALASRLAAIYGS